METIVEKFVLELEAQLRERRVAFTLTPEARAYLAKKGYDPRLRRPAALAADPVRGAGSADRRDPLRRARERRDGRRSGSIPRSSPSPLIPRARLRRSPSPRTSDVRLMPVYLLGEEILFPSRRACRERASRRRAEISVPSGFSPRTRRASFPGTPKGSPSSGTHPIPGSS